MPISHIFSLFSYILRLLPETLLRPDASQARLDKLHVHISHVTSIHTGNEASYVPVTLVVYRRATLDSKRQGGYNP